MKKSKMLCSLRLAAVFGPLTMAFQLYAQHYPAGEEGIKGGSLPPPGVYLRDHNLVYSGTLSTPQTSFSVVPGGQTIENHYTLRDERFTYWQMPHVVWMTDKKILGADYGVGLMVPFGYVEFPRSPTLVVIVEPGGRIISYPIKKDKTAFGLGDIEIEPLLLSWHKKRFDAVIGYSVWAPTGCFDKDGPSVGKGYWSHMITLGGVWYPDAQKTWAISLLNRYEINHEQEQTHITYGNRTTFEWGISKAITPDFDVGFIGYYQQAVTPDSGKGSSDGLVHVVGVGPEINVAWKKIGVSTSLRYVYEADAKGLPQGHLVSLTLTKQF